MCRTTARQYATVTLHLLILFRKHCPLKRHCLSLPPQKLIDCKEYQYTQDRQARLLSWILGYKRKKTFPWTRICVYVNKKNPKSEMYLPSVPGAECQVLSSAFKLLANIFMWKAMLPAHQYYLGTVHAPISVTCARVTYTSSIYVCVFTCRYVSTDVQVSTCIPSMHIEIIEGFLMATSTPLWHRIWAWLYLAPVNLFWLIFYLSFTSNYFYMSATCN